MNIGTTIGLLADQPADALLVAIGTDRTLDDAASGVDAALNGQLLAALTSVGFTGKTGVTCVLPTFGQITAARIVVVGTGKPDDITNDTHRRAWGAAARAAR
ncbi:MAG: M17 family peptidase N-terminal domain-containing protein, partial [Thermomicrobiaceae bacterium]